jgi:hypothetical protein
MTESAAIEKLTEGRSRKRLLALVGMFLVGSTCSMVGAHAQSVQKVADALPDENSGCATAAPISYTDGSVRTYAGPSETYRTTKTAGLCKQYNKKGQEIDSIYGLFASRLSQFKDPSQIANVITPVINHKNTSILINKGQFIDFTGREFDYEYTFVGYKSLNTINGKLCDVEQYRARNFVHGASQAEHAEYHYFARSHNSKKNVVLLEIHPDDDDFHLYPTYPLYVVSVGPDLRPD